MHTVVQRLWSVVQLEVADLIFYKRGRLFRVWRRFVVNETPFACPCLLAVHSNRLPHNIPEE